MKIKNEHGYQRFIVVFVAFLGVVNTYLMRNSLGLTMTKLNPKKSIRVLAFTEEFEWKPILVSVAHASFYIGYLLGHVPGAYLAEKYGGKIVLNVGLFSTAIFTLITPPIIQACGYTGLVIMRFLMGLGEAPAFPALGSLLSAWVPPKERGILSAFVLGGVQVGSLLSSLLSGEILHDTEGWGTIFFVFGAIGIAWNIIFVNIHELCIARLSYMKLSRSDYKIRQIPGNQHFTTSDTPETHPRISMKEKEYLKCEIGTKTVTRHFSNVPWTSLLTSGPVWALIIAQIGHDWALFFMGSYIPKYLRDALAMTFKEAGRYGALAYLVAWIISISSGALGSYLISHEYLTITRSRKLFTILSTFLPGAFFVAASYAESKGLAIAFIILAIGSMGAFYAGNRVNVLDICPNFTASLLGLVNGLGAIGGIAALFATGGLVKNQTNQEWQTVFWITLVVLVLTTIVYIKWASGEIQSWNNNTKEDNWLKRLRGHERRNENNDKIHSVSDNNQSYKTGQTYEDNTIDQADRIDENEKI